MPSNPARRATRPSNSLRIVLLVAGFLAMPPTVDAQLFENLDAFGHRHRTGHPEIASTWKGGREGPKDIDSGDLDGDGIDDLATSNLDGTITVFLNRGDGELSRSVRLAPGSSTLRSLLVVDLTRDGRDDIVAAAPIEGEIIVYVSRGGGVFEGPSRIATWQFARDLTVGDFNGDGNADLAVAGGEDSLRALFGAGDGSFRPGAALRQLGGSSWTRPVFALETMRQPGASNDELVASNAWSNVVHVFATDAEGELRSIAAIPVEGGVFDIAVGPVSGPRSSGFLDLVTVHRDLDLVSVRRGVASIGRFTPEVHQSLSLPGQPRSVELTDLDQDGWNDLVVVLRGTDRVLIYHNEGGTLIPAMETPVGRSPRAIASGDFNLDGAVDVAIANRISGDVDILPGYPGAVGFSALDQVYVVDGEIADLHLIDMNRDGRDDVVQLHRATGDVSVRLADENGALLTARHFPVGELPTDQRLRDLNADGYLDLLSANLGRGRGSLSVLLADGAGGFQPESTFVVPENIGGRLFSLEVADFDNDGDADVVAGFFDCRLCFYRNDGENRFTFTQDQLFLYESRAMAVGDFDQDGDIDVAGGSANGTVLILENEGDIMTAARWNRIEYPATAGRFGSSDMTARDVNGDGDLDLLVTGGDGVQVFHGAEGLTFRPEPETLEGTRFPASSVVTADLDADGDDEVVVSCHVLSCVTVLTRNAAGDLVPAVTVEVPAGRFVAAGDLDGDGLADLVGSGEKLWTALSSRRARGSVPFVGEPERRVIEHPVLNEILAINNALAIPEDSNKKPDWVELFNGSELPVSLGGWRIELAPLEADVDDFESAYTFPEGSTIEAQGFLQVTFSGAARSPFHTGFKLPGRGARLTLRDGDRNVLDRVEYPEQRDNVSYARYVDGLERSWAFNNFPSRRTSNASGGPVLPIASLDLALGGAGPMHTIGNLSVPTPGQPIRFHASASDDVGIVTLSLIWERVDVPGETGRVVLYDDGLHEDGERLDGQFAGDLESGLPEGAEIRFQMEAVDLSDDVVLLPDGRTTRNGEIEPGYYSIAVGSAKPALLISEVVARNDSGLRDEFGGTPDWVEISNCSDTPVPLDGVFLGTLYPGTENWFRFPSGLTLAGGEQIVVFCDGNNDEGDLHAPFVLRIQGDRLFLGGTAAGGANFLIDAIEYGEMGADRAFARQGCGARWSITDPTPNAANPASTQNGDADLNGSVELTDAVVILEFLFRGNTLACAAAADPNQSGRVDISDPVYLLTHLFGGGPSPTPERVDCD